MDMGAKVINFLLFKDEQTGAYEPMIAAKYTYSSVGNRS
jgi:hypothetical protein